VEPDEAKLKSFPGDSDQQQALIQPLLDKDGYNWGYDPYHYSVPEGSYSTNPDGPQRIFEFREMVQALNQIGLRVVMDVVYNHTNASGQNPKSVLDKIVPGYYHRLNSKGEVETSTCCQNTATEHNMMEKLMIDSVLTWATAYKVDGFRFDSMGHHMLRNMVNVRQALDGLTLAKDGVDGSKVYIYGEGWDFGEVANNARGTNASQLNIGGTGIGVFNDRLRDAARGGGPFNPLQEQGFISGLFDTPNAWEKRSPDDQRARLLEYMDWIRVGLAGNLRDYTLVNAAGDTVSGENVKYNGAPAGYTLDPQENIVYVSAHDNETLFDAVQAKAPADATLADRIRMNNLGIDLVMLGQGVPFFHAGDDMLRSKSLDRNSYNSGDWFNALDFTYASNNWAVGLPPAGDNKDQWPIIQPLLADPKLKPHPADILNAIAHFEEMLKIRRSSALFRLRTAQDVESRLAFLNTGPNQIPGLLVMSLVNSGAGRLDDPYDQIVVLFNAAKAEQTFRADALKGAALELHPVQAASSDPVVKTAKFDAATGIFDVPARTTAVFVAKAKPAPAATATAQPATAAPATAAATAAPTAAPTPPPPSTETPLSLPLVLGAIAAILAGLVVALRRRT
jgi:pullulanase-type alpha-1,6-glucosidase